jgi:hypothetical protein
MGHPGLGAASTMAAAATDDDAEGASLDADELPPHPFAHAD